MSYSSHSDFFSKNLPTSNNPNRENHEIVPKRKDPGLKGEILHRAIIDDFY